MANRAIELHDSTLEALIESDATAVLHFQPAYVHESAGQPGWDSGSGWVQQARLHVAEAQVTGLLSELPCDLWGGELRIDDEVFNNCIPIPLDRQGAVRLHLKCSANIHISGTAVRIEMLGDPTYVEEFRGHTAK
jgi:hypothetical protein